MDEKDNSFSRSGQRLALAWMARYLRTPAKASEIRETGTRESDGQNAARRARRLHSACLRNLRLYREVFAPFVRHKPSPEVEAALLLALTEVDLDSSGRVPAITDSWVGAVRKIGGAKIAAFANAVLRRAAERLLQIRSGGISLPNPVLYSHPDWLVARWRADLGPMETDRLLRWNQRTPDLYASCSGRPPPAGTISPCGTLPPGSAACPPLPCEGLEVTRWPGFFRLAHGITEPIRKLLADGVLTIRDPATRIAEDLLCASRPQSVLDLCASPGGKSRALLTRSDGPRTLVAADREERLDELRRNLSPWKDRVTVRPIDLDQPAELPPQWQAAFEGVLLDAPCTNTGVIQRKPDVKWRLSPEDRERMPKIQLRFLEAAAELVQPGGVLVYSTCSIEHAENRTVAESFLASKPGQRFHLTAAICALPTRAGHDGAGVFRFIRSKDR